MNDIEICAKAIEKYGEDHQILKCVEELSELTKALCKYFDCTDARLRPIVLDAIDEETADVEIMLQQLKMIFRNDDQVRIKRVEKIERLERRLRGNGLQ